MGEPPQTPQTLIFYIFGARAPRTGGGAAAPGGGANLAKCPFWGENIPGKSKVEKNVKKEGFKTMLEMIAAKF